MLVVVGVWLGLGADDFLMGDFLNSQRNNRVLIIIAVLDVDVMTTF